LNAAHLERFALRYVERYATTRGRLAEYLRRKIRERGWADEAAPDTAGLAQRMADLGYVNDRLFAESKASSMGRRGLGARRVSQALRHAGIEDEDADAVAPLPGASGSGPLPARPRTVRCRKSISPRCCAPDTAWISREGSSGWRRAKMWRC
jgi:regulatory protein